MAGQRYNASIMVIRRKADRKPAGPRLEIPCRNNTKIAEMEEIYEIS